METTPEDPRRDVADRGEDAPARTAGVAEPLEVMWARVAREWGIDFEPPPPELIEKLPELQQAVDRIAEQLPEAQDRRWLAAALAALVHSINAAALDDPGTGTGPGAKPAIAGGPGKVGVEDLVAVAVVSGPRGVLVGRRRDGIPRWVFPGGCVEPGKTAVQAAVRECVEETGVVVVAGREIGRRVHPVTGRTVVYVVCGPADADAGHSEPVVAAPDELVEVLWLSPAEVEPRMPDLFAPVRAHLGLGQRR